MTGTVSMEILHRICKDNCQDAASGVVLTEPYVPFIPPNWNGILVLAEAQNLSDTYRSYVADLKDRDPDGRIRRLGHHDGSVGVQPWDDGSLKLALASVFPSETVADYGVSNAVLWSLTTPSGGNAPPDGELMAKSTAVWKEMLAHLTPHLLVAAGLHAAGVAEGAYSGSVLRIRLPSPGAMSRMSGVFDEADLLRCFPEVRLAMDRYPEFSHKYRHNKIFFACHAVSMARAAGLIT